MAQRKIIVTKRPNFLHMGAHLPGQNISGLKRPKALFVLKRIPARLQAEHPRDLLILGLAYEIENSGNLLSLVAGAHLPIKNITNGQDIAGSLAPVKQPHHAHSDGKGVVLSSVMSPDLFWSVVPNILRHGSSNSNPF